MRMLRVPTPPALALLLVLVSTPASADRVTGSSVADDVEALIEAPFEADGEAWLRTAIAGAAVGATMIWVDEGVDRLVRERPDAMPWLPVRKFSSLTSWYGKSGWTALAVSAGLVGAVAAGGWIADEDRMVDTAAIMAESVAFSLATVGVTKVVLGRSRPHDNRGPHAFEWFVGPFRHEAVSFPSGHASTAFALAGAGAGRHPHGYVQIPAYLLAASAGLQRMDARAHWTSDVLTGALLGYAVAEFLVDRYDGDPADGGDAPRFTLVLRVAF